MDHHPMPVAPEPAPLARPRDPLAVALANASLLGVGYLMLGRRRLAVVTGLVTVVLATLLASVVRSVWFEIVVLLWWVALVAHGWFLAGGRTQRVTIRGQRLAALAVTVPVLLVLGLLRFDAARIDRSLAEARRSGDCAQALAAQGRVWFGHRVANAPSTARGDTTVQACRRLRTAEDKLATTLDGDLGKLPPAFADLAAVLAERPGHERMVEGALDRFLAGLPTKDPCHTVAVTDWLRRRQASNNELDRSADVAVRTAPAALVGCGDALMAARDWANARTHYQQLVDQYPGQELTAQAQEGVKQATLAIELANVRSLLADYADSQPRYCSAPARYSAAAPYRKGTNRALFYGNDEYAKKLPAGWRASDAAQAVLVVCMGEKQMGARVRSCLYEGGSLSRFPTQVTFRKIAIPVKAYELRTGKLVANTKVQIGGRSCPRVLRYTYYSIDPGPPSEVHVTASNADVHAVFRPLIVRR